MKIFSDSDTDNGLDERINEWIEENGVELLDVRVTYDVNKEYGFMVATATVIYIDKSEEEDEEFRLYHTKKELEIAGVGGVFNSPLFEVLEVDDGND